MNRLCFSTSATFQNNPVLCDNYEDDEFIVIGLRINGSKIECIDNTLE